jgi:hypothetical protein
MTRLILVSVALLNGIVAAAAQTSVSPPPPAQRQTLPRYDYEPTQSIPQNRGAVRSRTAMPYEFGFEGTPGNGSPGIRDADR